MQGKNPILSNKAIVCLLVLLLLVFSIYMLLKPLVLSVDSAYGFLAYQGSRLSHQFNVIQEIATQDIRQVNRIFISWWSPGQWLYPGFLNAQFGIRLGVGAIGITLFSMILGMVGYYRVFIYFKFSAMISCWSLLVIFASSTFYYSFIIYQGGEVLEFAVFPWFALYVMSMSRVSLASILGIGLFFLICFVAKTTMIIYCTLVMIAKIGVMARRRSGNKFQLQPVMALLILLPVLLTVLIWHFYLSVGPRPSLINEFQFPIEGFFVSVTSPLCSILSIQEWTGRISRTLSSSFDGRISVLFISVFFYGVLIICLFLTGRLIVRNKAISPSYKALVYVLYVGLLAFFLFAYCFDARIDYSSRHFKLLGYLFIPGLFTALESRIAQRVLQGIVLLFCLASIVDIVYLKEKWTHDRYVSVQYFYRNYEPFAELDGLDEKSYQNLLKFDRPPISKNEIIFVESTGDVGIDLHQLCIFQRPEDSIREKIYLHSGPDLIVCISKKTLMREKDILVYKFPDYNAFKKIAETENYLFFLGKGNP